MNLRLATVTSLSFVLLFSSTEAKQTSPPPWAPGYNHPAGAGFPSTFEAINMAVIPEVGTGGPTSPGKVIAWDNNSANNSLPIGTPWPQRFTVGAPEIGAFLNYEIALPAGLGDLFCAGHAWLPDGRLFIAGGTTQYIIPGITTYFIGSEVAAIWDPAQVSVTPGHGWTFLPPMLFKRWYPTVTLLGNKQIMVAGGVVDTDTLSHNQCLNPLSFDGAINSYEIWDITSNSWSGSFYTGPENSKIGQCYSMFGEYPRQHLISDGTLFVVGMFRGGNHIHHPTRPSSTSPWLNDVAVSGAGPIDTGDFRNYGSSVLLPNVGLRAAGQDKVMIIGGSDGTTTALANTVKTINGYNGTYPWYNAPSLNVPRMVANAVLLPDGAVLEIGGSTGGDYFATSPAPNLPPAVPPTPEKRPEIYRKSVGAWVLQPAQVSERMYHSTAALLPSGNVVTAGGDIRTWDWEVFTPDYLSAGQTRPSFASSISNSIPFGAVQIIQYDPLPAGLTVDHVVLMAPCSITHHSDMHQRYVELEDVPGSPPPNTIIVRMPPDPVETGTAQGSVMAPPGWYMMFLITNTGTPSIAQWIHLQ